MRNVFLCKLDIGHWAFDIQRHYTELEFCDLSEVSFVSDFNVQFPMSNFQCRK
jgi:hypothetical protein